MDVENADIMLMEPEAHHCRHAASDSGNVSQWN